MLLEVPARSGQAGATFEEKKIVKQDRLPRKAKIGPFLPPFEMGEKYRKRLVGIADSPGLIPWLENEAGSGMEQITPIELNLAAALKHTPEFIVGAHSGYNPHLGSKPDDPGSSHHFKTILKKRFLLRT